MFIPPGFDTALALEAADLVKQAYDQYFANKQGQPWNLQGNYENLALLSAKPDGFFAHIEPFGFVARNKATGTVFVTYRGTVSPEDWLSNITFPQVPFHDQWGSVEKGFSELYVQTSASVTNAVKHSGAAKVVVTGHSLGSSLATLATADLVINGVIPSMYNFASPRAGDPDFARKLQASVPALWRVVNTEDIVTTVPLATAAFASDIKSLSAYGLLHALNKLNFMHVGLPVSFTVNHGSIVDNHKMDTYKAALLG